MTLPEMHVWFRQYAQQQGMQNVRAVLPEQIDNIINTSTIDVVSEIVRSNVGNTNDRVANDNAKLASINSLRNFYKVKTITIYGDTVDTYRNSPIEIQSVVDLVGIVPLYYVDFAIRYSDEELTENNKDSVNYTSWFPIRIIDDGHLADTLTDYILSPKLKAPVMVAYSGEAVEGDIFEIYLGSNKELGVEQIAPTKYVGQVRMSYIKQPNKVAYLSDIGGTNVESDLPEHLQIPMLKHAVDLYRVAVQNNLFGSQENPRNNQQQMMARNTSSPENEGYQS